ncbi:unnamed protein product [Ranitomeya imitator]|uniref:Uncharacterized protein n=1 Tax=Ranitomeya imitator TaxID=111125 RepID=A0ABN9L7T3_9NEOB|nr:unnamed protein product [Ranitomeya imitator]
MDCILPAGRMGGLCVTSQTSRLHHNNNFYFLYRLSLGGPKENHGSIADLEKPND